MGQSPQWEGWAAISTVWLTQPFWSVAFGESKWFRQGMVFPAQYSGIARTRPDCFFKWGPNSFLLTDRYLPTGASSHLCQYSTNRS